MLSRFHTAPRLHMGPPGAAGVGAGLAVVEIEYCG